MSTTFTENNLTYTILGQNVTITNTTYTTIEKTTVVTSLIIPSSVTNSSTGISYTVTSIQGSGVLGNFTLATTLSIPDSIISFQNNATFIGWSNLTNLVMTPTSLLTGNLQTTFRGATSLTTATLYGSPTSLTGTFQDCNNLNSVNLPSSVLSFGLNTFTSPKNLIINWASLTSLTTINASSFINISGCGISEVIIPASVTTIAVGAFNTCNSLRKFTFLNKIIPATFTSTSFTNCATIKATSGTPCKAYIQYNTSAADISRLVSIFGVGNVEYDIAICFKENTKILTDIGYKPIETLRKGDLIKTLLHDYVPISCIGKKIIYHENSLERTKNKLYKCSNQEYPEILEPLIITGCHSILVENSTDVVNEEQANKVIEINGGIYLTDEKFRLPACLDVKTSIFETTGNFTVYHIALTHKDKYMNYGIFANGLLVESCSEWSLLEYSKLSLIE